MRKIFYDMFQVKVTDKEAFKLSEKQLFIKLREK